MKLYNITITAIPDSKACLMAARLMASHSKVPLHEAMEIVKHPPVRAFTELNPKEAEQLAGTLSKFGVKFSYSLSQKQEEVHQTPPIVTSVSINENSTPIPETPPNKPAPADSQKPRDEIPPVKSGDKPKPVIFSDSPQKSSHKKDGFGVRIMPPVQGNNNKKVQIIQAAIIITILMFIVIGLMNFTDSENRFKVNKTSSPIVKKSNSPAKSKTGKTAAKSGLKQRGNDSRRQVSQTEAARAEALIDSAKAVSYDHLKAINFYKIAISFNQYNLRAWQGLIETYRSAAMTEEMLEAQKTMNELFGESINSVSSLVKNHGKLKDAWLSEDGVYKVEYASNSKRQQDLLQETFVLTQGLRNICNCKSISLFASTGPGKGMIVHTDSSQPLDSRKSFEKNASITFLE